MSFYTRIASAALYIPTTLFGYFQKEPTAQNTVTPVIPICNFCKPEVINRQKIYETRHFSVLVDYAPIQEGHLLIVSKRDIKYLHDLNDEEAVDLNHVTKKVHEFFQKVMNTDEYIVLQKNGKSAGQAVPHLHVHMIPIKHTGSLLLGQLSVLFKIVFGSRAMSQEAVAKKVQEYSKFFLPNLSVDQTHQIDLDNSKKE